MNGHKPDDAMDDRDDRGIVQRIEALNYRGLRYVSQSLRPFEVLVGPNASGKSTFIDTIALISDFTRDGLDRAILFAPDNGASTGRAGKLDELTFGGSDDHFELALEITIPATFVRPKSIGAAEYVFDVARYELAIGKAQSGELSVQREMLWLIDSRQRREHDEAPNTNMDAAPFPAELPPPSTVLHPAEIAVQTNNVYVAQGSNYWWPVAGQSQENPGNAFYIGETDSWSLAYRVGARRSVLAGLPEDPARFPVAIWVRDLLRDGVRALALNSAAMRRPVSPSASREFDVSGANLPLVIQDLAKQAPVSYRDWIAHVQTILPDIEGIAVRERSEDRFRYLAVTYENTAAPIPSWLVSDGTLRVLALTLLAYLPEQPRIYLIEEPENGIHPKAIEGVYQSLSSVYGGQVLVATHSPLILSLAEPDQLLCFARTPSGAVAIVSGDQHPILERWRGQTDLSTLYAAGVLG